MRITKNSIRLHASAKGVITHFLYLPGKSRITNVVQRLKDLTDTAVDGCMEKVMKDFISRHRNIEEIFLNHFNRVEIQSQLELSGFSFKRKLLLGAFFTKEYSIQSAALFNPSIVAHPDQEGLQPGEQRFVMSLRATGEGHISSIVFQTGIVDDQANIRLDKASGFFTCLEKKDDTRYSKDFIKNRIQTMPEFDRSILNLLPDSFSESEANHVLNSFDAPNYSSFHSRAILENILDSNYDLQVSYDVPINEKVIFPNAEDEKKGIEDVRLVKFIDGEHSCYYGTYTAYDGKYIRTQLIETTDFNVFKIRTLYGAAVSDKGMALFPEKVNGKYAMISRQGGERINIMFSEDIYSWETYELLLEPLFLWELVQLGNCGSPIKTERGWLLLIHGVGAMRTYVISALLLDLHDPSRVIGRLDKPLLEADESEREGYVPNVVYTCGMIRHGNLLIIPYAISDSATGFATIMLEEILNEMNVTS
jgi:predicted GH43/DUF377 family glycosyl hydrolase